MNVENVIKSRAMELQADGSKVYVVPDIPEKKLNGAISGIAPGTNSDYVIAVIDTSLLGTGKTGAVILGDRIRFNNANEILTIFYKNVSSVSISGNLEEKNGATINIVYKDHSVHRDYERQRRE